MEQKISNKSAQVIYFIAAGFSVIAFILTTIDLLDFIQVVSRGEEYIYGIALGNQMFIDLTGTKLYSMFSFYPGFIFSILGTIEACKMNQGKMPNKTTNILILIFGIVLDQSLFLLIGAILTLVYINKVEKNKKMEETIRSRVNEELKAKEKEKESIATEIQIDDNSPIIDSDVKEKNNDIPIIK